MRGKEKDVLNSRRILKSNKDQSRLALIEASMAA